MLKVQTQFEFINMRRASLCREAQGGVFGPEADSAFLFREVRNGKFLDNIKFEKDSYDFLEELDSFGIKPIKALTKAIVDFKINDDYHDCCILIDVLEEKVSEVDQCVQRLLHEMTESMPKVNSKGEIIDAAWVAKTQAEGKAALEARHPDETPS